MRIPWASTVRTFPVFLCKLVTTPHHVNEYPEIPVLLIRSMLFVWCGYVRDTRWVVVRCDYYFIYFFFVSVTIYRYCTITNGRRSICIYVISCTPFRRRSQYISYVKTKHDESNNPCRFTSFFYSVVHVLHLSGFTCTIFTRTDFFNFNLTILLQVE